MRASRCLTLTLPCAGAAAAALLLGAGHALAVSGGGYSYGQQGCTADADRNDAVTAQPGCHNATLQVNQGSGGYSSNWHVLSVNTDQTAPDSPLQAGPVAGDPVHSGSVTADPGQGSQETVAFDTGLPGVLMFLGALPGWAGGGGAGAPPAAPPAPTVTATSTSSPAGLDTAHPGQAQVYFGADDNLDLGEHDGVDPAAAGGRDAEVANGPSDGGALQVNTHPQGSLDNPQGLSANLDPTDLHDPLRAADAAGGGCADGLCVAADTSHRTVYRGGCHTCQDEPVYGDQSTTGWRSPDCNSGSVQNQNDCGAGWQNGSEQGDITQPYEERGAYTTDPGVMVYEDPDPQASPALPMYPVCEEYVGTEGVWVCGAPVVGAPGSGTPSPALAPAPVVVAPLTPAPPPALR